MPTFTPSRPNSKPKFQMIRLLSTYFQSISIQYGILTMGNGNDL